MNETTVRSDPAFQTLLGYATHTGLEGMPPVVDRVTTFEQAARFMAAEPEGMMAWLQTLAAETHFPLGEFDREAAREFLSNFAKYQQVCAEAAHE